MIDFLLAVAMIGCFGVLLFMIELAWCWWMVRTGRHTLPERRPGVAVDLRTNEWVITNEPRR